MNRHQRRADATKAKDQAATLDELLEIERDVLEMARANIAAMEAAVKAYPTLEQEIDRIWIAALAQRGIPADQAKKIREALHSGIAS